MAVGGTQLLLLLACIIATSEGLTCNDITCCTGTVCVEETNARNELVAVSCVIPPSCDDLTCPAGYECVNETQGRDSTHSGASCKATCSDVTCPPFYQCIEEGPTTECVLPSECVLVQCPNGTSCQVVEQDGENYAVCVGETCSSVSCFNGNECFTVDANYLDRSSRSVRESSRSGANPSGGSSGQQEGSSGQQQGSGGQQEGSSEEEEGSSEEEEGSTGPQSSGSAQQSSGSAQQSNEIAICLPSCGAGGICPPGFVCEEDGDNDYKLICREAESCFEVQCPTDQQCEEVTCGTRRARRSSSGTRPTVGTQSSVLLQCVDTPQTAVDINPPPLESIGNQGAAITTNGAGSLAATKLGTLVSAAAALVLPIFAFFLLCL